MQKNNWLRLSLASMIVAGIGAGSVLQGCSDDDVTPSADSGVKTDSAATSTATPDSSTTSTTTVTPDAAPPPKSQKIIFVHAANWLGTEWEKGEGAAEGLNGSVRLCLKAGPAGTNPFLPVPALPNTEADIGGGLKFRGLLRGTGGVLPASTNFSTTRLEGFALNATRLAAKGIVNESCGDLFSKGFGLDGGVGTDAGSTPLVDGVDYINVGEIPAGTFANESTFVVSVTGCAKGLPDTDAVNKARCGGAAYDATTGNLKLNILKLDRGAVGATELGAQFIHAASAVPANVPVVPGVVNPGDGGADAGSFKAFAGSTPIAFSPDKVSALAKLPGVSLTADRLTLNPGVSALSQYTFESAVAATAAKTPVALGAGFVYIAVGDPGRGDTAPGNLRLHFLAFPTDPTVPPLTQ